MAGIFPMICMRGAELGKITEFDRMLGGNKKILYLRVLMVLKWDVRIHFKGVKMRCEDTFFWSNFGGNEKMLSLGVLMILKWDVRIHSFG